MQDKPRKLAYPTIPDLCHAIRQSTFQLHRFQQFLTNILQSACGINQQKGLLEKRISEYAVKSPVEWAKENDQLFSLLGPGSFLMSKVIQGANNQMSIDVSYLPKCVTKEFPQNGTYQSRLISGLRKQVTNTYIIRQWQWFWITIIRSFMNMNLQERRTVSQDYLQDQFYYNISSNFYLGFFQKCFASFNSELKGRILNLIHIYLIEEVFYKFESRDNAKSVQVKYRLKPHYLYLLYILILTNKDMEEEMAKNYFLFLQKIAENYSSLTALTRSQTIRNIIRVWITLTTRSVTVESVLIDKLKYANQKQGWFKLSRCPIDKFAKSLDRFNVPARQSARSQTALVRIIKLLDKESQWIPSYGMISILQQLLLLESKRSNLQYRKDSQEINDILVHAVQRNLNYVQQEQTFDNQAFTTLYDRINKKVEELYSRKLSVNSLTKSINNSTDSRSTAAELQRRKLINYQPPRQVNVWQHPLQHNEFYLLYISMYWIASQMDKILPVKNKGWHPRVNLRIFCNPFVFAILMAIIVLLVKYI